MEQGILHTQTQEIFHLASGGGPFRATGVVIMAPLCTVVMAVFGQGRPSDWIHLVLVVSALAVDAVALWAISARISEFGFSPNKVAALGENLVLLVNLGWSAVLYGRFVTKRGPFAALERWQTAYLPVYGAWAVVVALVFPVLFGYR